jgi:ribosome silencing factor RsfS/YbeB/iojap
VTTSLADDKAEDIVVLDLDGKATFADRMVIATGMADRQLQAMATHIVEKLERVGRKRLAIEGLGNSDWVLIDAGDIVVHLFRPEARVAYALEKMWGTEFPDAPA